MAAFDDVATCAAAVARIIAAGVTPSGLEMMDGPAIRAVEAYANCGYPAEAAALLLCELDGLAADVAADVARVQAIFEQAVSDGDPARARRGRARAVLVGSQGGLPRRRTARAGLLLHGRHDPAAPPAAPCSRESAALSAAHGLPVANVFHAGDGNLHPLIMFDAGRPGDIERAERVGAEILELCIAAGGTVTGEHGVGVEKLGPMCSQFGGEELATFHAVKRAFDPRGLLNPGKAVPTLARCADYGALRVHGRSAALPRPAALLIAS